jgi:hypothetical protein
VQLQLCHWPVSLLKHLVEGRNNPACPDVMAFNVSCQPQGVSTQPWNAI